jgi:hypothetical protein
MKILLGMPSGKVNSYNLYGDFKYSTIKDVLNYDGFKTSLNFAKTSGRFRYLFYGKYLSENYNVNDLGLLFYHNHRGGSANVSYRILNATTVSNKFRIEQELNYEAQNTTGKTQEACYKTVITANT